MLKVHETTTVRGELVGVFITIADDALVMVEGDESLIIPDGALDAVMARYGAPLELTERITEVARLPLADGTVLRTVRHLARFDVIARDYVIYDRPGAEPICAMATTVVGALTHLARAAARG